MARPVLRALVAVGVCGVYRVVFGLVVVALYVPRDVWASGAHRIDMGESALVGLKVGQESSGLVVNKLGENQNKEHHRRPEPAAGASSGSPVIAFVPAIFRNAPVFICDISGHICDIFERVTLFAGVALLCIAAL